MRKAVGGQPRRWGWGTEGDMEPPCGHQLWLSTLSGALFTEPQKKPRNQKDHGQGRHLCPLSFSITPARGSLLPQFAQDKSETTPQVTGAVLVPEPTTSIRAGNSLGLGREE